jgi:hypothetical protein
MRRGLLVLGIVIGMAAAGCGGGGSSTGSTPSRADILQAQQKMQAMIKSSVDTKLAKLGRPAKEIACVDRNIEAMTSRQIAERVVEGAPAGGAQSVTEILGPLGRGCP